METAAPRGSLLLLLLLPSSSSVLLRKQSERSARSVRDVKAQSGPTRLSGRSAFPLKGYVWAKKETTETLTKNLCLIYQPDVTPGALPSSDCELA